MAQPPQLRQNRLKVVSLFIFCLLVILAIQFMVPKRAQGPTAPPPKAVASGASAIAVNIDRPQPVSQTASAQENPNSDADLYIGIRKPTPQEIAQGLPESKDKPTVIMFHSQYCLDCKKMSPLFDRLMPHYPGILYRVYDIMTDTKTAPGIFNAFKPQTVPVMIFITPQGTIENVFYNEQSEKTITAALDELNKSAKTKPAS